MDVKELFNSGIEFDEFISSDDESYKEKALEIYHNIQIDEGLINRIEAVKKKINVLVFAEMWCPDCVINLPALKKICDLNPNIVMRAVAREGNEECMEDYKINGKAKIPTFVFMDESFNVLGSFIEIPDVIKEIVSKGDQVDIIVAKRKYRKGEFTKETIQDILKKIS